MRITFFGRLRDGAPPGPVPVGGREPGAGRAGLGRARPELRAGSLRIAVNDEMIRADRAIGDDDEIAFLPPMSGG